MLLKNERKAIFRLNAFYYERLALFLLFNEGIKGGLLRYLLVRNG